jgi:hypothetical protein
MDVLWIPSILPFNAYKCSEQPRNLLVREKILKCPKFNDNSKKMGRRDEENNQLTATFMNVHGNLNSSPIMTTKATLHSAKQPQSIHEQ